MRYSAVVIGTSAGGMEALRRLVTKIKGKFALPVVIVQHVSPQSNNYLVEYLKKYTHLKVKEADEKEKLEGGTIYIAPANYHTLIELDKTISLSTEQRVSYARPSIDVTFETAAYCYRDKLIGVILTGGNNDGAKGLALIKEKGGYAIVQNPDDAEADSMPRAAIKNCKIDFIANVDEIAQQINQLEEE